MSYDNGTEMLNNVYNMIIQLMKLNGNFIIFRQKAFTAFRDDIIIWIHINMHIVMHFDIERFD